MSTKGDKVQLNTDAEQGDQSDRPKKDTLYFENKASKSSSTSSISSTPLLESPFAKKFTPEFQQDYKDACESADSHTMRDERLEERIGGQRRLFRFKRYFTAIYISFLPILITGLDTFSTEKRIKECFNNDKMMELSQCVKCNGNSFKYNIHVGYNVLVYIFWVIVVLQYYLFFYCTLKKSKLIMKMFSFQIKVKATLFQAFRRHWIGFSLYTTLLVLAIIFNKLVRFYADKDDQFIQCDKNTKYRLVLEGDDQTGAQYATSLILTSLFSLESFALILNLALQPAQSYFTAQRIFHSSFNSDVAYILQQISKISKEITYSQFYELLDKETVAAGTSLVKFPFANEQVRHAILLVIVYKINKERLYLANR